MPLPKFVFDESLPAKPAKLLNATEELRPGQDIMPLAEVAKPLLNAAKLAKNGTTPTMFLATLADFSKPLAEPAKWQEHSPRQDSSDAFSSLATLAGSLQCELPPVTLHTTPLESARARLAEYRATYGAQLPEQWLEHAKRAVETVRATFAPDRQQYALTTYLERYCQGQPAQVIATHVIALELWAVDNRQRQNGVWLDVACQAVGLDIDTLAEYQKERTNDPP